MNDYDARLKKLDEIAEVQSREGNWRSTPYMQGLANGLILAQSILHDREPKYLSDPATVLSSETTTGELSINRPAHGLSNGGRHD